MPVTPACAPPLDIGLIGYGAFGRLTARRLSPLARIAAFDPATPPGAGDSDGAVAATLAEAAARPIVVLATPVGAIEAVVAEVSPHLRPGALVLDVGSVKVRPVEAMLAGLPAHVDIVATHPLFGPQSARDGLAGLKIAVCEVRGGRGPAVAAFLRERLALDVYEVTPEAHDREAALAQGLTHLVAKVLVAMEPLPTRLTTKSFDLVMQAVEMVRHDAPEVFAAIEHANPYAAEVRARFIALASALDDPRDGR